MPAQELVHCPHSVSERRETQLKTG
jgi:hypothetical protein